MKNLNVKKLSQIHFKDDKFRDYIFSLNINSLEEITTLICDDFISINEIKYFPNLEILSITSYELEELDLSYNKKLKEITIGDSEYLKTIDFSKNITLETLKLQGLDNVNTITLENNLNLKALYIGDLCNLEKIDLTNNEKLEKLDVEHGGYLEIELGHKEHLKEISCSYGRFWFQKKNTSLPNLETLIIENCEGEGRLNVSDFKKLKKLDITWNQYDALDLSINKDLEYLSITANKFTSIDLTYNVNLKILFIGGDFKQWDDDSVVGHKSLDLSKNINLTFLSIEKGELNTIDLSHNLKLKTFIIERNPIKELDVSNNKHITSLRVKECLINEIDLSKNTQLEELALEQTKLKSIKLPTATTLSASKVYIRAHELNTAVTNSFKELGIDIG